MIYSKKQIDLLIVSLEGNVKAFHELMKMSRNLAALESAIKADDGAIEWLIKHDAILAIFVNAIEGNKSAIRFLLNKGELVLAATANLVNGDEDAAVWLKNSGYKHYTELADSIRGALGRRHD